MSKTAAKTERADQLAKGCLAELGRELGISNMHKSSPSFAPLHILRDRLPTREVAQLGDQLPMNPEHAAALASGSSIATREAASRVSRDNGPGAEPANAARLDPCLSSDPAGTRRDTAR